MAKIKLNSKEDFLKHPIAQFIKYPTWKSIFQEEMDDSILSLMEMPFEDLLKRDSDLVVKGDHKLWICIAVSHQNQSVDELIRYGKDILEISEVILFQWAFAIDNIDVADQLFTQASFVDKKLMLEESNNKGFEYACSNGSIKALDYLKNIAKPGQFLGMITENKYSAFQCACTYNQLEVIQWLLSHLPRPQRLFESMVAANEFAGFKKACEQGYFDIIKWFKDKANPELFDRIILDNHCYAFRKLIENQFHDITKWFQANVSPQQFKTMISSGDNFILKSYVQSNNLEMILWLKSIVTEDFKNLLDLKEDNLLKIACEMGHFRMIHWLKGEASTKAFKEMIMGQQYNAFIKACEMGHLDIAQWLKGQVDDKEFIELLKAQDYLAFRLACKNGHIQLVTWLEELAPSDQFFQNMLQAPNNQCEAFGYACKNNHLPVLKWFEENTTPNQMQKMIEASSYFAFMEIVKNNNFEQAKWMMDIASPNRIKEMLICNKNSPLKLSCDLGNLQLLQLIAERLGPSLFTYNLNENFSGVFNLLCEHNRVDILEWLKGKVGSAHLKSSIRSWKYVNDSKLMNSAFELGHFNLIQWIANEMFDEEIHNMFLTNANGSPFISAYKGKQLDILNWIKSKLSVEALDTMIQCCFYQLYGFKHNDLISWLFDNSLPAFADAELHYPRYYSDIVQPYRIQKLAELHLKERTLRLSNPNAVFDLVDQNQAKLCFYMIRSMIRENKRELDDDIRFLINIPSVKALAHQSINDGCENELLMLAISEVNNQVAAQILLNIPAVRNLSIQNNHYMNESRLGVSLRVLAQNYESSMTALTQGEQKRLETVKAQYQSLIEQTGVDKIIEELRLKLIGRYQLNPAIVMIKDVETILPYDFNAFKALNLSVEDESRALKAYYHHKDHTAWRYLQKPNPWMHPKASYVYVDENNQDYRYATFEDYLPVIALLYLAVIDEDSPPIDDFTLAGRLEHFIDELALIGRAHNWDKTRLRHDKENEYEEYDDLEGDRPSCFSGVKRRLFQSVVGHSLIHVLTMENIKEEFFYFLREHFKQLINDRNRAEFIQAFESYFIDPDFKLAEPLKALDITPKEKQEFIVKMQKKYGEQFDDEPSFIFYIEQELQLRESQGKPVDYAHALKFDGFVYLYKELTKGRASQNGFFAERVDGVIDDSPENRMLNNF